VNVKIVPPWLKVPAEVDTELCTLELEKASVAVEPVMVTWTLDEAVAVVGGAGGAVVGGGAGGAVVGGAGGAVVVVVVVVGSR
jgi:hypothetical protein